MHSLSSNLKKSAKSLNFLRKDQLKKGVCLPSKDNEQTDVKVLQMSLKNIFDEKYHCHGYCEYNKRHLYKNIDLNLILEDLKKNSESLRYANFDLNFFIPGCKRLDCSCIPMHLFRMAVQGGNFELVEQMIQLGNKNIVHWSNAHYHTPLFLCALNSSRKYQPEHCLIAKRLLEAGADINAIGMDFFCDIDLFSSPLLTAVEYKNYHFAAFLINRHAIAARFICSYKKDTVFFQQIENTNKVNKSIRKLTDMNANILLLLNLLKCKHSPFYHLPDELVKHICQLYFEKRLINI